MSAIDPSQHSPLSQLRDLISEYYCIDEIPCIHALKRQLSISPDELNSISTQAIALCQSVLKTSNQAYSLQSLLQEFELSSDEGIALMGLSEALLRIPDQEVAMQLVADRLAPGHWKEHVRVDKSPLLNASTMMLMLTGKLLSPTQQQEGYVHKLLRKVSQPIIHKSVRQVIRQIAGQFVYAETIDQALQKIKQSALSVDYYSLDMLGEAAVCERDAEGYFRAYETAIKHISAENIPGHVGISVKLSALSPRYEFRHAKRCIERLTEKLDYLLALAGKQGIAMTIDAEEADRLELGLDIFVKLFQGKTTPVTSSLGLAVQAYSPRAFPTLQYLKCLAEEAGRVIPVRLVKGAYWDTEIKRAQADGLPFYPVFTSKQHTDVSYIACAEFLLAHRHCFYPQFATHNALTICHILNRAPPDGSYEFQRLHGMGEDIYQGVREQQPELKVRVYGPVGEHEILLPYLVRRILENGANSSFLKQMLDKPDGLDQLCEHPLLNDVTYELTLPLPKDIYQPERANSEGINLANRTESTNLLASLTQLHGRVWDDKGQINPPDQSVALAKICSPYDGHLVGTCYHVGRDGGLACLTRAEAALTQWRNTDVKSRVTIVNRFGDLLESARLECVSLLIREAGKTIPDAINEVREAVDFARYYARQIELLSEQQYALMHIAGEQNSLFLEGRGVFLCISPWNFPLAIFCGQVCAALVSGNTVLAKPAVATPLIARFAVQLFYQAGCPEHVLQLVMGKSSEVGHALLLDDRLSGVAFTGSTQSAKQINRTLAEREGAIIPFIAETGGQNVMIVDSSALPEQVVRDVIRSSFYAAGQRCSAVRVLYLQDTIAETILELLDGAIQTLCIGDPACLETDIGPLISEDAKSSLVSHCHCLDVQGRLLFKGQLPKSEMDKNLLAPHVFEIESIHDLNAEHFGPVLHVIRYSYDKIHQVLAEINDYGFGLTCGIHSRNERWAQDLARQLKVGNAYINRDTVGAVVGAQPFGGQGLSGTGFKAGGPNYLLRFLAEKTVTTNLSAIGGDVDLVASKK